MTAEHRSRQLDLLTYPSVPGHRATDTSRAAAESMMPSAAPLRRACLDMLARHAGTADEVAAALGQSILAIRPRCTELRALGLIRDSGARRPNASGRSAIVWRAT